MQGLFYGLLTALIMGCYVAAFMAPIVVLFGVVGAFYERMATQQKKEE